MQSNVLKRQKILVDSYQLFGLAGPYTVNVSAIVLGVRIHTNYFKVSLNIMRRFILVLHEFYISSSYEFKAPNSLPITRRPPHPKMPAPKKLHYLVCRRRLET